MTAQAKLTDTQTATLKAAAGRPEGNINPLPTTLRGGARAKVIEGLLARGLIVDADGRHSLTDAGYAAVGKRRPLPKGVQKMDTPDALTKRVENLREQRAEQGQTGCPTAGMVPTPGTRRMGVNPAWFAGSRNGNAQPRGVGR